MAVMSMSTQDEALPEEGAQAIQLLPDDAVTHAIPGQQGFVPHSAPFDPHCKGAAGADQLPKIYVAAPSIATIGETAYFREHSLEFFGSVNATQSRPP